MKQILKKLINKDTRLQIREVERKIRSISYRFGSNVECPTCGGKYSAFMPFRFRPNAQCPDCKSLERHRYVFLNLRDKVKLFEAPHKRILHFAPDICMISHFKNNPNIAYVTADYMSTFTPSITIQPDHVMSIDDIKFPDNSFDVVMAVGVLVMVPDDSKAMREILRVLKPGGFAILHDPIDHNQLETFSDAGLSNEQKATLYHGHDQRWYYGQDYGQRLEKQGFKVDKDTYASEVDYKKYGFPPTEKVYIARKL